MPLAWSIASTTAANGNRLGKIEEYVYRERPVCRIILERERHWIDVDGTSTVAEVRRTWGSGGEVHGVVRIVTDRAMIHIMKGQGSSVSG